MTPRAPRLIAGLREGGSLFRRKAAEHHLETVLEMTDAAFLAATEQIRQENPGYSEVEAELAAIRQRVGEPVFERAFPDATL